MRRPPLECFALEEWFRRFAFRPGMINLSPSNPISPTLGELVELAGVDSADLNELSLDYSQTAGASSTRTAIARLYHDLDPEHVVVTSGATEAILLALEAVVDPGDRVVIEHPVYGIYEPLLRLLGAEVIRYELTQENRFDYDFARFGDLLRRLQPSLVIVNPYNNPTGHGIASDKAIRTLVEFALETRTRVWSDDVFRLASIDSAALDSPIDHARDAISVGDMTKAWGLGGLRIGWLACRDDEIIERALNSRDYTTNSNSTVSERLAEYALVDQSKLLAPALDVAREARDAVNRFVSDSHGVLSWIPPRGGYCGWIRIDAPGEAVTELCATMATKRDYLLLPGSVFGEQWGQYIRVGLAAGASNLVNGLGELVEEARL